MAWAERRAKPTAAALKAACTIPQLVQVRDGTQAQPAEHVLDTAEVDTIEALVPTLEGNTEQPKNPHPPGSLARANWALARLGGRNCCGQATRAAITRSNGM